MSVIPDRAHAGELLLKGENELAAVEVFEHSVRLYFKTGSGAVLHQVDGSVELPPQTAAALASVLKSTLERMQIVAEARLRLKGQRNRA